MSAMNSFVSGSVESPRRGMLSLTGFVTACLPFSISGEGPVAFRRCAVNRELNIVQKFDPVILPVWIWTCACLLPEANMHFVVFPWLGVVAEDSRRAVPK
jgi:hypothetical protein